jgi:hypothetical protein
MEASVSDEKLAPVSFRAAKPVDPKTRHPFSGEVLDAGVPVAQAVRQPDGFWRAEEPEPHPVEVPERPPPRFIAVPESFRMVLADLRLRREELDRAIDLIERFMP